MADRYVFSDEAGNFDFSRNSGASRYFILGTVTAGNCRLEMTFFNFGGSLGGGDCIWTACSTQPKIPRMSAMRSSRSFVPAHSGSTSRSSRSRRRRPICRTKKPSTRWPGIYISNTWPPTSPPKPIACSSSPRAWERRRSEEPSTPRCVSLRFAPGCLLARGERSMPTGRRLLRLGDPAQVGAGRHALLRPDQGQDQIRVRRLVDREKALLLKAWPPDS